MKYHTLIHLIYYQMAPTLYSTRGNRKVHQEKMARIRRRSNTNQQVMEVQKCQSTVAHRQQQTGLYTTEHSSLQRCHHVLVPCH
jgi:hypothetical protein